MLQAAHKSAGWTVGYIQFRKQIPGLLFQDNFAACDQSFLKYFRQSIDTGSGMERYANVDWLNGEVNLTLMMHQSDVLTHFWMHEVDILHMPRHWLRTASDFLQRFNRVTDGTPADNQLGTYLIDVDLMLSADKT